MTLKERMYKIIALIIGIVLGGLIFSAAGIFIYALYKIVFIL